MQRSTDRILTTHTGSLPRPDNLVTILEAHDQREVGGGPEFKGRVTDAVGEIVRKQVGAGVSVVNDGEMSKVGYSTYVTERLTGFEGESRVGPPLVEARSFPEFFQNWAGGRAVKRPVCTDPIAWRGTAQVQQDVANLKAALEGVAVADAFMTAASPGVVWYFLANDYYPSDEAYVFAVADAMRHEYQAIVDAGFVLQLDCPDLAMGWNHASFADKSIDDFRKFAEMHVDALNHALADIPADRVRLHLCWGNYEGPHTRDIALARIFDVVLKARAIAFSFEGANPRHEHEWKLFQDVKLPEGTMIIPGVLDSTTNFVEHPELVAERIVRYARLVGRENVIAGSDCGFSTFARSALTVHPTVTWAKLQAMAEGARLASEQLWGKG
jgi:5-methyltetrahydropteroyltriglutamate--homocysteine methyltransferase